MFSKASVGQVWTTITFTLEDKDGAEQQVAARFLIQPLPRREYQARRREQLQKASEAVEAALKQSNLPEGQQPSAFDFANDTITRLVAQLDTKLEADEDDAALLCERTHDWVIFDENTKEQVPFSREFLRDLLAFDQFYVPYAERFAQLCTGSVRKNSSPGPAGVPA